jgi:hypothetical protein
MLRTVAVLVLLGIIVWQVYKGVTVQEVGVEGLFSLKFDSDSLPLARADAALELVAVDVIPDQAAGTATLDIKVRNTGDEVAFVHRIEFVISDYSAFTASGGVAATGAYQVEFPASLLPPESLPHTFTAPVSQSVDPSGATAIDRFTVVAGARGAPLFHNYTFRLRVLYNDAGESEQSGELTMRLQGQ